MVGSGVPRLLLPALFLALWGVPVRRAFGAPPSPAAFQRGIALGLFSVDAGWSYRPLLEEIAGTGADHVELVVAWYLEDVRSVEVHEHPRFTAPPEAIERAIVEAHRAGLRVLLLPILRLERQAGPDEWRGGRGPAEAGRPTPGGGGEPNGAARRDTGPSTLSGDPLMNGPA